MRALDLHKICVTAPPFPPTLTEAGTLAPDEVAALESWLRYLFVPTSATRSVGCALERLVSVRNPASRPGAKRIGVLTAPNGAGKSTMMLDWCAAFYAEQFPEHCLDKRRLPTWDPEPGVHAADCPIVWVNIDAGMGHAGLDKRLLEFFGLPALGSVADVDRRARAALRQHQVKVLVIDDAHFLRTRKVLGRQLLDHLKSLVTEIGVHGATLVLVGADLEDSEILSDPQIACRAEVMSLPIYGKSSAAEMRRFQAELREVEQILAAHVPIVTEGLIQREYAGLLWRRTQGRLGDTVALLVEALTAALHDGKPLAATHIEQAPTTLRAHLAEQDIQRRKRPRKTA